MEECRVVWVTVCVCVCECVGECVCVCGGTPLGFVFYRGSLEWVAKVGERGHSPTMLKFQAKEITLE
jgi:hypothetical protein